MNYTKLKEVMNEQIASEEEKARQERYEESMNELNIEVHHG